jgi:hypothetical protein
MDPSSTTGPAKALGALAEYHGIEAGFRDARGNDIVTTAETQKCLLAGMGISVASEHSATAALETAQRADLPSTLPPVIVICCADGRCAIPLSLPPDAAQITWRLELEDGSERRGATSIPKQRDASTSDSFQFCLELIDVPWGYHTLNLPELQAETSLIVSPGCCWLPDCFGKSFGLWGVAAQLLLLRSENNWGIGDFADLRRLVAVSGERGCDVLGLNPLHQMFLDNPGQASPYSPLSRLFLNVLYITVADAPGYADSEALRGRLEAEDFHAGLAACRAARHVDYATVAFRSFSNGDHR